MSKRVRSVESEISALRRGALPANLKFIHWSLCIRKNRKNQTTGIRDFLV